MKICFVGDSDSLHVQRWAKYFVDKGHEVHVVSEGKSKINGATVHNLITVGKLKNKLNSIIRPILGPILTRRIVNKIKPDIVHAHYITSYGFYAALTGFHPLVVTAWGSDILIRSKESRILNKIARFVLKRADLITCEGEKLKEVMIELGADPKNICRFIWGIDTQKFNPRQRSEKLRNELRVHGSPIVISSKNLETVYDIESLIKSIPFLLKNFRDVKFVITGKGSQEENLKQLVKSSGVSSNVIFVGFIPNDQLPKYMASAEVYVCTSTSDGGLAVSTKEAMACELPVVITDLEVNKAEIEDGVNGFIVPIKDPKSLAEKIAILLKDKDIRLKFGKNGRKMIKEKFDFYNEMEKVEKCYKGLINHYKK